MIAVLYSAYLRLNIQWDYSQSFKFTKGDKSRVIQGNIDLINKCIEVNLDAASVDLRNISKIMFKCT